MPWLILLLFSLVDGLSSSEIHNFQINEIKPHLISISNKNGYINVTVKFQSDSLVYEAQSLWWVNGRIIADGEYDFHVNTMKVGRTDLAGTGVSYSDGSPPDKFIDKTSIVIPPTVTVRSLQLQMVSNLHDVTLDINLLPLGPGKTLIEHIPEYTMTVDPKNTIEYERGDRLQFRISFKAKDLDRWSPVDVSAEFIGIETCLTPRKSVRKTSRKDNKFLRIWTPTSDDDLSFNEMLHINNSNYMIRRLHVDYGTNGLLPKGLLKISAGYKSKSRSSCLLFSGVKVAVVSFLQPLSDTNRFFHKNNVAMLDEIFDYAVRNGGDLDITISAVGGQLGENRYNDIVPKYPDLWLTKDGRNVTAIVDVKRLFQREITVRLKNVTQHDFGRYTAMASLGTGIAKLDIIVYVTRVSSACGRY